ncbi:MAG: NUDIX domain-containing protein [Patescibacteria group bacterium]|jgi:ADP-ribose pyrophosphatase YjhB (NUDIX family)
MDFNIFGKGVFVVNLLAIVYDEKQKKILIGKRENDPNIPKLSWCFPGGRPGYEEDLEFSLIKEVKKKTGIEVRVKEVVFAKTYPEKQEFLSIYYLCEPYEGMEQAGESFKELMWIKPTEVTKYFTTSIHPKVLEYLTKL